MSLMTSIKSTFDNSELPPLFPGGYHRNASAVQPDGELQTMLIVSGIDAPLVHKYSFVKPHAGQRVQFTVVGIGASNIEGIIQQVSDTMSTVIMDDDGVILNAIQVGLPVLTKAPQFGPAANDVWQANYDTVYTTQETA